MKYIVLDHFWMYLFPADVPHNVFFHSINIDKKCTSAGFVSMGKCCGRSESLGVDSNPNDDNLLRTMLLRKVIGV